MTTKKIEIFFSVFIGLVVTAITCTSINNNIIGEFPAVHLVAQPLQGTNYWGFFLPWIKQVCTVPCQLSVIWQNFALNTFIWAVATYVIIKTIKSEDTSFESVDFRVMEEDWLKYKLEFIKEKPKRKIERRSKYDPIIDDFLESEAVSPWKIARITANDVKPSYLRTQMMKRIVTRKLDSMLKVSAVGTQVIIEKI